MLVVVWCGEEVDVVVDGVLVAQRKLGVSC